jgi:5-methylphenazine-1-carboxylate 1-monooxygenase
VRLNRKGGPERVIDEVENLAPAGFEFVDRVAASRMRGDHQRLAGKAGFTPSQVNK